MPSKTASLIGSLRNASKKSLGITGLLSGGFGFFADVLEPIAPFASYICIASLIGLVLGLILWAVLKKDLLPIILFCAFSFIVTGLLTLMKNSEEEEKNGVLATMMPALANIQSSLGIIQKDVSEIKDTTNRIEDKTDKVLEGINTISKSGGIIANPETPEEFYHNARVHELGGNYAAARKSYLQYFRLDTDKLDPHLRFVKFLKIQEGRSGARESYQEITAGSKGSIPQYVKILLLDRDDRVKKLSAYAEENPGFGPVWYQLSQEYSYEKMGSQTISDRREELKYTKKFKEANDAGQVVKYMIDQELVSEWVADADKRRKVIEESMLGKTIENPVTVSWMGHNGGWTGSISIKEHAKEVFWKIKGSAGDAKKTKKMAMMDDNEYITMRNIQLSKSQKPMTILVSYIDNKDTKHGPFEFAFNPISDGQKQAREMADMTRHSWVALLANPAKESELRLYFSNILVYRAAFEEIKYGINKETPDTNYEFPASTEAFAPIPDELISRISLVVPEGTTFATVQVTYKGGEKSEIVRVEAP